MGGLAWCVAPSSEAGWYTNLFLIPLLSRVALLSPGAAT